MQDKEEIIQIINTFAEKLDKKVNQLLEEDNNKIDHIVLVGSIYKLFMKYLGIYGDENSKETPFRVAKMMLEERCKSLYEKPPDFDTFFVNNYDEYIVVNDIPFYSLCSHHHITFFGKAHIAYWPNEKILGLSKFARIVTYFSAKPQLQESLTTEIIEYLWDKLSPRGIMVKLEGRHMCLESRGAKAIGSITVTQQKIGDIDKKEVGSLMK